MVWISPALIDITSLCTQSSSSVLIVSIPDNFKVLKQVQEILKKYRDFGLQTWLYNQYEKKKSLLGILLYQQQPSPQKLLYQTELKKKKITRKLFFTRRFLSLWRKAERSCSFAYMQTNAYRTQGSLT